MTRTERTQMKRENRVLHLQYAREAEAALADYEGVVDKSTPDAILDPRRYTYRNKYGDATLWSPCPEREEWSVDGSGYHVWAPTASEAVSRLDALGAKVEAKVLDVLPNAVWEERARRWVDLDRAIQIRYSSLPWCPLDKWYIHTHTTPVIGITQKGLDSDLQELLDKVQRNMTLSHQQDLAKLRAQYEYDFGKVFPGAVSLYGGSGE